MSPRLRSLWLMAFQLILVLSLWGKLHYDRARLPRYWIEAAPVDPDLPIRGRYLALDPVLPIQGYTFPKPVQRPKNLPEGAPWSGLYQDHSVVVTLQASGPELVAKVVPEGDSSSRIFGPVISTPGHLQGSVKEAQRSEPASAWKVTIHQSVPYFIPETTQNPAHLAKGETLWMEVSRPPKGPLRVIRLAVKDASGSLKVLPY